MKKLVLVLLFTVLASPVFANNVCVGMANMAIGAMEARQAGVSLIKVLAAIKQTSNGNEAVLDIATAIALEAYEYPKMLTKKGKTEFSIEYGNLVYKTCINNSI